MLAAQVARWCLSPYFAELAGRYEQIGRYNDDPYASHWFEKRLKGG